jgi:hypothetical protein
MNFQGSICHSLCGLKNYAAGASERHVKHAPNPLNNTSCEVFVGGAKPPKAGGCHIARDSDTHTAAEK